MAVTGTTVMMTIYTNHFYHKVTVAVTGTTVMMTIYTNDFYHKVTVAVTVKHNCHDDNLH